MRLGALIEVLKRLPADLPVNLGEAHSYRGYYDQLSFEPTEGITAAQALKEAEQANGRTFTGYKGGDYVMGLDTMCWASPWGLAEDVTAGEHLSKLLAGWLEESLVKPR